MVFLVYLNSCVRQIHSSDYTLPYQNNYELKPSCFLKSYGLKNTAHRYLKLILDCIGNFGNTES